MAGLGSNNAIISNLKSNKAIAIISSAVAATLVGAGLAQVDASQGTTYANSGNCASYSFSSTGDPVIATDVHGLQTGSASVSQSQNNFLTVGNTAGGPTKTSSTTTPGLEGNWYNTNVTISGPGFTMTTTASRSNGVVVKITDGNGTHQLTTGQSLTEPNGTKITVAADGKSVNVAQALNSGGYTDSNVYVDQADVSQGVFALDIAESAVGAAVVNGLAVQQATGQTGDALINPCETTTHLTGTFGPAGGGNPTAVTGYDTPPAVAPQPTPVPQAWQTGNSDSATENS